MPSIVEEKEKIRKLSKDVLQKITEKDKNDCHRTITLISVEENIALWAVKEYRDQKRYYYYTDLQGNLLFNGECFFYATPFSDHKALVKIYREPLVLDISHKELVEIPESISWESLNGFRNSNMAVFDEKEKQWGSYHYDDNEKGFLQDIPFIWDTLEFSRKQDQVYVGKSNVGVAMFGYDVQTKWDERDLELQIATLQLDKKYAYDLKRYKYLIDMYKKAIRFIIETFDDSKTTQEDFIKKPYNISDYYFEEEWKEEYSTNQDLLVQTGNLDEYKRILGKHIK